jgi:bacterioferritin (cytochrome b1)
LNVRHLDDALRLERDLLAEVRELITQLPQDNAYRLLLERHKEQLEEAIERIEKLGGRRQDEGAP